MGKQTHYEFQPRQRLTTDALNEQDAWTARMTGELMRRTALGDRVNVSGVISGLEVNVVANTMNIAVGGGLACKYDSTAEPPDATHLWIEVADDAPIIATLDAGGVLARWDVVEIAANVVDGDADVLDVYDPSIGAAVGTLLAPLKICTPIVTVRKGTPSVTPKLPAGTAGVIPLAYIYVAAGAVQLNVSQVLRCRPILLPRRGVYRSETVTDVASPYQEAINVQGGGWRVEADGLTGFVNSTMTGTFSNGGLPFMLPANTNCDLSAAGNFVGGGLPVVNQNVYAYVAPPPYPSGYDTDIAPRELYIADVATPGVGKFVSAGARNCVVLMATGAPNVTAMGNAGGPNADYSFIDSGIWGNFSVQRSSMVYIGAAFYATAIPGFIRQRIAGNNVGGPRKSGVDLSPDIPIASPTPYYVGGNIAAEPAYRLPAHVRRVRLVCSSPHGDDGWVQIQIHDQYEPQNAFYPKLSFATFRPAGSPLVYLGPSMWVTTNDAQEIAVSKADTSGGDVTFHVYEYEDSVLALR